MELGDDSGGTGLSEAEVARLKRRDREHAALLSSARALVQIGDVDSLLQELVDRAYELIGSDLAYLSSYDVETGNLWVRASRGSASQDLKTLTVPAGYGLAAKIAETHTPQWSNAYSGGPHALHSSVSAAVSAEGIESLLGVPLLADGEFLGALFAAYRYRHEFNADEISLLTALADHAAVVLHRAQMVSALEDAATRSAQAKESAELHAHHIERGASLHEALTHQVLNGDDIQSVCTTLATTLQREVAVARPDSTFLAGSRSSSWWTRQGRLRRSILEGLQESAGTGRAVSVQGFQVNVVVCTAVAAGAPIITVVAEATDAPTSNELRIIERTSQLMALLIMQEESQVRAEEALRVELLGDLISGGTSTDALRRRADSQGYPLADRYAPVVMALEGRDKRAMRHQLSATVPGLLVTDSSTGLIILVPEESSMTAATRLRKAISNPKIGDPLIVYETDVEISEIPASVDRLGDLVDVLPRFEITHGMHSAIEFSPYLALFGENADKAKKFVDNTIGVLLKRDESKNSELTRTLFAYLDANASQIRAAETLHVHVNTVKQRLGVISSLLGDGWDTNERAFRIHVALRLHFAAKA